MQFSTTITHSITNNICYSCDRTVFPNGTTNATSDKTRLVFRCCGNTMHTDCIRNLAHRKCMPCYSQDPSRGNVDSSLIPGESIYKIKRAFEEGMIKSPDLNRLFRFVSAAILIAASAYIIKSSSATSEIYAICGASLAFAAVIGSLSAYNAIANNLTATVAPLPADPAQAGAIFNAAVAAGPDAHAGGVAGIHESSINALPFITAAVATCLAGISAVANLFPPGPVCYTPEIYLTPPTPICFAKEYGVGEPIPYTENTAKTISLFTAAIFAGALGAGAVILSGKLGTRLGRTNAVSRLSGIFYAVPTVIREIRNRGFRALTA